MKEEMRVRSFSDLRYAAKNCRRILTLFSGGVDSTFLLKEIANLENVEITCLTVDLGDGVDEVGIRTLAEEFGAQSRIIDGKAKFVESAVLPAMRANAQYLGLYPISSSLSRPIIATYAVEVAKKLECNMILHTANQSQNSLRRLNGAINQLGFSGYFGTPYEYSALSRAEKISQLNVRCGTVFSNRTTSGDSNLWCREFESGDLDNPELFSTPPELYKWTKPRNQRASMRLRLRFEAGNPVEINGTELSPIDIIFQLNEIAGSFQIGRFAGLEHLEHEEKVLEVREAPAAHVLMSAYRHLEMASLDSELIREKISLEQIWVREAIEGRWFGDLRKAADAFIKSTATKMSGVVEYELREGVADVCSIVAKEPRYLTDRDGWEKKIAKIRSARTLDEIARFNSHSIENRSPRHAQV